MKTDGSVIIDTKIIDGGMEKGFEAIKNEMSSVGVAAEELGNKLKLTLSEGTSKPVQEAFKKVQDLEAAFQKVDFRYKKELRISDQLEAELARVNAILTDTPTGEFVPPDEFIEAYMEKDELSAAIESQKESLDSLKKQTDSTYDELEAARRRLSSVISKEADKEAKAEEKAAKKAAAEKQKAIADSQKGIKSFNKRLKSIVAGAFVFNVMSKGLRSVTEHLGNALKSNEQFEKSSKQLKGALLTAFQPIYETLVPVIVGAMQILTQFIAVLGRFFASLSGKSAEKVQKNAKALYEQANATDELGKSAKNAEKALAGFDEINTLQSADSGAAAKENYEDSGADFNLGAIDINKKLEKVVKYTPNVILALGILLAFSGANIPLGIGMIAVGAAGTWQKIKEDWGAASDDVVSTADAIAYLGGVVLTAIGIIICYCCPSHLGLGIGMIVSGAIFSGYAIATNWNAIKSFLKSSIGASVALFAGTALIVIGVITCMASVWGLGIGLIVAGASALAAVVVVNWNAIIEALQGPIGAVTALVSAALIVLGAIMVFSGASTGLGIGLLIAGAVGLAAVIAVNWNSLSEILQGPIGAVTAIVSIAFLALGAVMVFSGANIGLGIGLLVVGAAALAAVVAFNWNAIIEALQGPLGMITALVSAAVIVLGAVMVFSGANIGLGIGLLIAGVGALASSVAINWDVIVNAIRGPIGAIIAIVSGALLVLGVVLICCGVITPVTIGLLLTGVGGLTTTASLNKDAIVQWVKDAWQGVKEFFKNNIAPVFTAEWWQNLAKKCGYGLKLGFVNAINGIISAFESMINWVIGGLNKISITIPDWVPLIGGETWGVNIQEASLQRLPIPKLAKGAVLPANKPFLSVVGDQKHGTNIEAPLDTIKQALAEVLEIQGGAVNETVVTVNFAGDLAQLARTLKPAIETETRRKGSSLVTGGTF